MHMTSSSHGALAWGSIGLRVKAVVRNVPVARGRRSQVRTKQMALTPNMAAL